MDASEGYSKDLRVFKVWCCKNSREYPLDRHKGLLTWPS